MGPGRAITGRQLLCSQAVENTVLLSVAETERLNAGDAGQASVDVPLFGWCLVVLFSPAGGLRRP